MTVDNGLKNAHGLDNIGFSQKSSHYINTNKYRNLYVVIEIVDGVTIPVNYEMLGEARRLMDSFNTRYNSNEKVYTKIVGLLFFLPRGFKLRIFLNAATL